MAPTTVTRWNGSHPGETRAAITSNAIRATAGTAVAAAVATAAPAAAATSGSQTVKGIIVASEVSGTRTVTTSVVTFKGRSVGRPGRRGGHDHGNRHAVVLTRRATAWTTAATGSRLGEHPSPHRRTVPTGGAPAPSGRLTAHAPSQAAKSQDRSRPRAHNPSQHSRPRICPERLVRQAETCRLGGLLPVRGRPTQKPRHPVWARGRWPQLPAEPSLGSRSGGV